MSLFTHYKYHPLSFFIGRIHKRKKKYTWIVAMHITVDLTEFCTVFHKLMWCKWFLGLIGQNFALKQFWTKWCRSFEIAIYISTAHYWYKNVKSVYLFSFIIIFIYLFKIFYFLFSFHCSLTSFFSKLERQKNWSRYIYVRLVLNIFIQYIIEGLARHRSRWTTGLEVHDWSSFQCRSWRMWLGA